MIREASYTPRRTEKKRGRNDMTLAQIILLILGTIGAIYFGRKRKYVPMVICILVAAVMLFLLVCLGLLIWGID